jgi:hypothetical protein
MKPRIHVIFGLLIVIVLGVFVNRAFAQMNTITTVAGNGTAGFSGDGGPATGAQLNAPFGIAVDSAGNIYIAEWSNHRIRKVSSSGTITTFAGTGTAGFGGDGGPATDAALDSPEGVAVDSAGNVYIADSFNNRIRKVDTSGIITTIAGNGSPGYTGDGPAASAGLNDPSGVAVDKSGNVYVADNSNHRIRKISGGTISTIAGTGVGGFSGDGGPAVKAQVFNPTHLTVDSGGNLYIADYSNNRIRKIDTSGTITTVAGTATPDNQGGYSGDGGPATSAQFKKPAGVAVDAAGNLYIADAGNDRVRKVSAGTGIVTALAGGGTNGDGCNQVTASVGFPIDIALTNAGDGLYIVDYKDNRIRLISTAPPGVVPSISSISPSSGVSGRDYQVTLSGNGFVVSGGNGCADGTTNIAITGAGVTISGQSISNDTITATFSVAPDAPAASHDVTVSNSFGASNAVKFSVGLPTPTITSISPSSGLRGTTVTVTLAGTNFVSGSGTTVKISTGGVAAGSVSVQSDTSLTATFQIDPAATIGKYFVFVSTPNGGDSNSVQFTVGSSTPTITGIAPSSGVRGSSTQVTITGTNFAASSSTVKVGGAGITVSNVTVKGDTSITATFTVASTAVLGNYVVVVASPAGGQSNTAQFAVNPQGPTITYTMPSVLNPTQQVPVQLALPAAEPDEVDGVITMTFEPNPPNITDDANVTFVGTQASARSVGFAFKPNTTTAFFGIDNLVLQAGTVAGTIHLSLDSVKVNGQAVTPNNSTFNITIPLLPPVITGIRLLNRTTGGFTVEITGYATSREVTQATFLFTAGSGGALSTAQLQPDIAATFAAYYQSDASTTVGSAFVYTQPFIAQKGDANVVTSVSATLTNSQGTSAPATAP